MNNKIRVAVVGVGHLGKYHARIYSDMQGVELVAVMDIDADRAHEVAHDCDSQAFTEIVNLPQVVDAVSIVVPTRDHLSIAKKFLERGVHTLIEKPLASTVEEAEEIIDLANSNGAILQVGHLERFNPGVIKLVETAKNPRFIEAHRLGKFSNRSVDIDVVSDLMIHDIDIILSMVGSEVQSIEANGCPVITERIDIANARIRFQNKAVANITASRISKDSFRRFRVFAEDRYLSLDFQSQQIEQICLDQRRDDNDFPNLVQDSIEVVPQLPLNAELDDFIDCVRTNRVPLVSGTEGLMAVRVASQIQKRIAEQ